MVKKISSRNPMIGFTCVQLAYVVRHCETACTAVYCCAGCRFELKTTLTHKRHTTIALAIRTPDWMLMMKPPNEDINIHLPNDQFINSQNVGIVFVWFLCVCLYALCGLGRPTSPNVYRQRTQRNDKRQQQHHHIKSQTHARNIIIHVHSVGPIKLVRLEPATSR